MKLALATEISSTPTPQSRERASVRIVLLALISFGLGVGATAFWFHLAANRNEENSGFQTAGQPTAGQSSAPAPIVATTQSASPATVAGVKQALPNYTSLTLDQGAEMLRQAALKEFASATKEMQTQIATAEAELSKAKQGDSAADVQSATQHLRQVQAEQTAKIQQIAANLQLQLAALQQLKAATNSAQ